MANPHRVPCAFVVALTLFCPAPPSWAETAGTPAGDASEADAGDSAAEPSAAELAAEDDDLDADEAALLDALAQPWTGDLDGMAERGFVRVGVAYDPVYFSYDGAVQQGLSVDALREFEKRLRETLKAPALTVVLTPLPRDAMLDALTEGRIDLLTANLTITEARAARVDFSDPVLTGVSEIVVTGPAAPANVDIGSLHELPLHMRLTSSYHEHATALNEARRAAGEPPLLLVPANESLEDHDLLELVDVGVIPAVVADSHLAEIYGQVFGNLTLRPDLALHEGGEIAWAMRKDSPRLMKAVNAFVKRARKGSELGNILYRRWIEDSDRVVNAIEPGEDEKLREVFAMIRAHAESYEFDPILIAAQGFQESGLDQSKRSRAGAIGIMQVMPATARDPNVAIPDIHIADRNVEAGVKYLRFLRERYFDDPGLSDLDRVLFSFAAYNAGPGNIAKARKRAARMGLDPNVWFGNVEIAAARAVSREPVIYVRSILKYFVTYQLHLEREGIAGN